MCEYLIYQIKIYNHRIPEGFGLLAVLFLNAIFLISIGALWYTGMIIKTTSKVYEIETQAYYMCDALMRYAVMDLFKHHIRLKHYFENTSQEKIEGLLTGISLGSERSERLVRAHLMCSLLESEPEKERYNIIIILEAKKRYKTSCNIQIQNNAGKSSCYVSQWKNGQDV